MSGDLQGYHEFEETNRGRLRREEAESRVKHLSYRIQTGNLSRADAIVIVKELLRVTRSPSKRPVYQAWLREEEENAAIDAGLQLEN